MNQNCRLALEDSVQSGIVKLSEGNSEALMDMLSMATVVKDLDPDLMMGAFGILLSLDSYAVYGADIHLLFSDICGKNAAKACTVLRAVQIGVISESDVKAAIQKSRSRILDLDQILDDVCERLPAYNREMVSRCGEPDVAEVKEDPSHERGVLCDEAGARRDGGVAGSVDPA